MPVIYTGSYKIPFEAGKSIGVISAEKESYTRGVEQARLDIAKQQIKTAQTERALARIDADEKEKRRQLEWEAIAKRSREAVEESKRRFGITQEGIQERWEGLSGAQKLIEQRKIKEERRNLEFLKEIQQRQTTFQPAGAPGGYDLRTEQPVMRQVQDITTVTPEPGFIGLPDYLKRQQIIQPQPTIKQAYTPPADIADYLDTTTRDTLERIHKKIKPLTSAIKKKLRQDANVEAFSQRGTVSQRQAKAISIYNKKLKEREVLNNNAHIELGQLESKLREATRKAQEKAAKPTARETTRQKDLIKYFEEIGDGMISVSAELGFSHDEKKRLAPILKRYNAILKKEGKPELELYLEKGGVWGAVGDKWRLREKGTTDTLGLR